MRQWLSLDCARKNFASFRGQNDCVEETLHSFFGVSLGVRVSIAAVESQLQVDSSLSSFPRVAKMVH